MSSGVLPGFPAVPEAMENEREHRREIARRLNGILQAKVNAYIDVTMTAGAATTTITDARIGITSAVFPAMAKTANGAACIAAGIWVDNQKSGSCRINHRNNAAVDQTARFLIIG